MPFNVVSGPLPQSVSAAIEKFKRGLVWAHQARVEDLGGVEFRALGCFCGGLDDFQYHEV